MKASSGLPLRFLTSSFRIVKRRLVGVDGDAALFAAVLHHTGLHGWDFFEVVPPVAVSFETFWAKARRQVIGFDCQMAVLAAQPVRLWRQKNQVAVGA
jgi:hypothetical protein